MLEQLHFILEGCVGKGTQDGDPRRWPQCSVELKRMRLLCAARRMSNYFGKI